MSFTKNLYLHALNLLPEFGPAKLYQLGEFFGDFENAFYGNSESFGQAGIESALAEKFFKLRERIDLKQEQNGLERENIKLISYRDSGYPKTLLETNRFPALLYVKGRMENNEEACLAVVGTRKITTYGRSITPNLVEPLCLAGMTIVSGLAYGVDALAHQSAVKLNRRTIAVLGGGLDEKSLYPQNHAMLAMEILEAGGALLSEYPPLTPCLKHHFISRNRIISGLSLGTLVIECGLDSGSLITARHALEQNRSVYAVPGPIYSAESSGPNNLIKMGAKLVTQAQDILEDLNLPSSETTNENRTLFADSPAEAKLLSVIQHKPLTIDELIKLSGLPAAETGSTLTFLEMKGKIRNLGGQQYSLRK